MNKDWFVYILECNDQSLYTGITNDIKRRVLEHNTDNLKGAKSLHGKRPVKLVYCEKFDTITKAASREKAIKNWKRKYKLQLIRRSTGFTL